MLKNNELKNIADEYGTPSFLFDADELRERVKGIKEILNDGSNRIGLCYSIKANPFLIPSLIDVIDMLEVCSPGELKICKSYKVPPEMIIYSGVHKEETDITEAVEYGASILTAESIRHYELISSVSRKLNTKVRVILRLSSKSQFGMSLEDIEHILEANRDDRLVIIEGLHYFAGTQRTKLKHQREELVMLKEVFAGLREKYGLPLLWFEYGPGLACPYFEGDDFSDTLRPVKELAADLKEAADGCSITVEMGRFIASSCGYYLSRVCDVKRSYNNTWVILDGGINHVNYPGQMMGLKTPVIIALQDDPDEKPDSTYEPSETITLCGSLCTTNDVIARRYTGREPGLGDVLVFCNIGAYSITEGLNLFLSRDMPVVLIRRDGIITKARDVTETWRLNS
ncbi:MAG: diaminopimelate decarboxylase [Lachnospiraceae bacterium]|nr:diaminopimelate decarboxylase [Lachnospiraceae bacterium]